MLVVVVTQQMFDRQKFDDVLLRLQRCSENARSYRISINWHFYCSYRGVVAEIHDVFVAMMTDYTRYVIYVLYILLFQAQGEK